MKIKLEEKNFSLGKLLQNYKKWCCCGDSTPAGHFLLLYQCCTPRGHSHILLGGAGGSGFGSGVLARSSGPSGAGAGEHGSPQDDQEGSSPGNEDSRAKLIPGERERVSLKGRTFLLKVSRC